MSRRAGIRRLLGAAAMVVAISGASASGADLGLDGSWAEQECASDEPCLEQALVLRLAAGDRTRWRAALGAVRARAPEGVVRTLAGSIPLGDEQLRRRRGDGQAGAGGSGAPRKGVTGAAAARPVTVLHGEQEWASGLTDLYAGLTSRLAGGGSRLYALDVEVDVKAPVASEEEGLGTGEWDGRLGVVAERRFWALTLFGGAGWSRIGDPAWAELSDTADGFAGVESEPVGPGLRWSAWVEGAGEVVEEAGPTGALAVACSSGGASGWRVTARAGLTSASETFGFRVGYRWGTGRPAGRRGGPDS